MESRIASAELGKKDAEQFISLERIEYEPFIAMSDLHMVRKTIALTYQTFNSTVVKLDSQLWQDIDDSANKLAGKHGEEFNFDQYADGFTEGVAAVWDKIRDKVL